MKINKRHLEMFGLVYVGEGEDPRMVKIPDNYNLEFMTPHPDFDETWSSTSFMARAYDDDTEEEFEPPKAKEDHHWIAGKNDDGWFFIEIEN